MAKTFGRHLFILSAAAVAFAVAGHIGLFCEQFHEDLAVSVTAFGLSATGIMAGLIKVYHIFLG